MHAITDSFRGSCVVDLDETTAVWDFVENGHLKFKSTFFATQPNPIFVVITTNDIGPYDVEANELRLLPAGNCWRKSSSLLFLLFSFPLSIFLIIIFCNRTVCFIQNIFASFVASVNQEILNKLIIFIPGMMWGTMMPLSCVYKKNSYIRGYLYELTQRKE